MPRAFRRPSDSLRPTTLCTALLLTMSAGTHAASLDYQLETTLVRSDNINLSEDNQIDETVVIPRLRFDVEQEGANARFQAHGDIDYRHYVDDSFDDETRSEFAGQLNWSLLPQRLGVVLEDYLSQEPITLREGTYPGNVQRVNVFIGGPSLHARFNDVTRAQLDLRATDADAEVTETFNGRRYTAAGILQRELSSTSQASLNLVATEAEFDDPTSSDFSREDAFIGYRRNGARASLEADVGYSRVRPKDDGDTASSPVGRVTVAWQVTPRSQIRVRGFYQLADSVQDLIVRQQDLRDPIIPDLMESFVYVNPSVYRQRRLDVDYQYEGERLAVRLRPTYQRLRYIDGLNDDRNLLGVFLSLDYRLLPRLLVSTQATARNREFLGSPREDHDRVYTLGLEYQMTQHWSLSGTAIRNTRDSTEVDPRYGETAFLLSVAWQR